MWLDAFPS